MELILDSTRLGGKLEKLARRLQAPRIARNPHTSRPGGRVVYTDEQLEFHPASIEQKVIREYNERLIKLGLIDLAIEKDSGLTAQDEIHR